jgi:hypothetical protein
MISRLAFGRVAQIGVLLTGAPGVRRETGSEEWEGFQVGLDLPFA